MHVAIRNSDNLHSNITLKWQKYIDLEEELIRIRQSKMFCLIPPVLSATGISANKLKESLKQLNLRPALYILMQKTVVLNTCVDRGSIVLKVLCYKSEGRWLGFR